MFKFVYRLLHIYSDKKAETGEPLLHVIELGYFSNKTKVKDTIIKYKDLPGFNKHSIKSFKTKRFMIRFNKIKNNTIYELYHSYLDKDGYEEFKYLGVYATREEAERRQVKLMKSNSRYRNNVAGFEITEEVIDSDNLIWNQGFDTLE